MRPELASQTRFFSFSTAKQLSLTCCIFIGSASLQHLGWVHPRIWRAERSCCFPSQKASQKAGGQKRPPTVFISQSAQCRDHTLREDSVPDAVAQTLIGHDSKATNELYVSVGRETLENARAVFHEI